MAERSDKIKNGCVVLLMRYVWERIPDPDPDSVKTLIRITLESSRLLQCTVGILPLKLGHVAIKARVSVLVCYRVLLAASL